MYFIISRSCNWGKKPRKSTFPKPIKGKKKFSSNIEEVRTSPKSENVQNEVVKPKMSYF